VELYLHQNTRIHIIPYCEGNEGTLSVIFNIQRGLSHSCWSAKVEVATCVLYAERRRAARCDVVCSKSAIGVHVSVLSSGVVFILKDRQTAHTLLSCFVSDEG
jgi:hypothetical protein